ncbi:MAG: conserved hypothetical protein TIGR00252 [Parcubacteria group bacterium Gr01-1014_8]|nr:MAG: conserved hypothetical protein TIGR00252 [Parcubacteria group bacterium Gr01-1014_8]
MGISSKRTRVGQIGERIASIFLERKGYKIVERNYRKPWGEIDIIAEKQNIIHFVEVKALSRESNLDISREKGNYRPEEQIHPVKLQKISRTAELYMNEKNDSREFQIDAVGVFVDEKKRTARCRLFEQIM